MKVTEYIENDGPCVLGFLIKDLAIKNSLVHPKYGEIDLNEVKGKDVHIVMDGNPFVVRVNEIQDKRKYSYVSMTMIDPKTKREICSGTIRRTIDTAKLAKEILSL